LTEMSLLEISTSNLLVQSTSLHLTLLLLELVFLSARLADKEIKNG